MKQFSNTILFWAPRVLCLLFASFLAMFSLDAFREGHDLRSTAFAVAGHLIPTALVLGALVIAWRWEWLGALLFLGLGAWYTLTTLHHPSWILCIAGPAFLIGVLFLLNWLCLKRRAAPAPSP